MAKNIFLKKVALVTGGCGFIGSHLVEALLQRGLSKILVLDNLISGKKENLRHVLKEKPLEIVIGDVRNYELVKKLVSYSDFVFHLAASKMVVSFDNPRLDLETNIGGTVNVLEAARKRDVRVIYASTGSVLGSGERPMPEDYPPNPTSPYGISKLAAERYCRLYCSEFGVKVSIIRYFHVFGPRQDFRGKAGVISIFLYRVLEGKSPVVYGSGKQVRCFTYVLDDVGATLLIAEKKKSLGQIYNVASPAIISVKDLAKYILQRYGSPGIRIKYGQPRKGENKMPIPDTSKIKRLGFKAKFTFEEGVELTRQWIKNESGKKDYTLNPPI